MEYTDAVLRRLRDRLIRYRSETRVNGRKRPWHRVAMDILDAESVSPRFYEKEASSEIFGEALRRFAAGLQTPTMERLDAITAFLTEQKFLAADDLTEVRAPLEIARQLAAFFGVPAGGVSGSEVLCGQFLAERKEGSRLKYVLLEVTPVGDAGLQVEETEHITSAATHARHPAELRRFFRAASIMMKKLDGWMVVAPDGAVLVFVRDRLTGRANVYTLLEDDREIATGGPAHNVRLLRPVPVAPLGRIVPLETVEEGGAVPWKAPALDQMIWHFSRQVEG